MSRLTKQGNVSTARQKCSVCPWCGATPFIDLGKRGNCQLHGEPFQCVIVYCKKPECPARPKVSAGDIYNGGKEKAEDEAIKLWNTRALAQTGEIPTNGNTLLEQYTALDKRFHEFVKSTGRYQNILETLLWENKGGEKIDLLWSKDIDKELEANKLDKDTEYATGLNYGIDMARRIIQIGLYAPFGVKYAPERESGNRQATLEMMCDYILKWTDVHIGQKQAGELLSKIEDQSPK